MTISIEAAAQVRLTERDHRVVALLAGLRAARSDDVAQILGGRHPVGMRTANGIIRRWGQVGLTESNRPMSGRAVITVTRTGAVWAGSGGLPIGLPGPAVLHHTLTVAALAALYVAAGAEWVAEPHIELPSGCAHRPDGLALRNGHPPVAIEVERTTKSAARWGQILDDLITHWAMVHYWATPPVAAALTSWSERHLTPAELDRLRIRELGRWSR